MHIITSRYQRYPRRNQKVWPKTRGRRWLQRGGQPALITGQAQSLTDTKTFFHDQIFRCRYQDFSPWLNFLMPISKLFPVTKSTETLSLRPKFPVLMPRLLYETIFFVPFRRRSKRWQKSLMSHSGLQVVEVASHLTPVPGGVGPMTVAMLMYNTVQVMSPTLTFSKMFVF